MFYAFVFYIVKYNYFFFNTIIKSINRSFITNYLLVHLSV